MLMMGAVAVIGGGLWYYKSKMDITAASIFGAGTGDHGHTPGSSEAAQQENSTPLPGTSSVRTKEAKDQAPAPSLYSQAKASVGLPPVPTSAPRLPQNTVSKEQAAATYKKLKDRTMTVNGDLTGLAIAEKLTSDFVTSQQEAIDKTDRIKAKQRQDYDELRQLREMYMRNEDAFKRYGYEALAFDLKS